MKVMFPRIIAAIVLISVGWFSHSLVPTSEAPKAPQRGGWPRPGGMGTSGYEGRKGNEEVVPVEVSSTLLAVIRERVRSSGILEPEREVTVLSRVEGTVDEVVAVEGARIREGQSLCAIDQKELLIAAEVANIELQQANANYKRLEDLAKTGDSSGEVLENARFSKERAQAGHQTALINLGHSQPKALFDGIVMRRRIEPGQYVRVGDELFTYADFEPLRVRMYLPEGEVQDLEKGQRCVLRSESDGPILTEGTIERISPVIDRQSLTVEVLAIFPEASVTLRPGSFVHVDVITRTLENRVVVPRKAVASRQNRNLVYRLLADETVQEVEVVTGFENDSIVVIEEGLSIGDKLVVQGIEKLKDRSKVSVYRSIPVEVDELTVEPLQTEAKAPNVKIPAGDTRAAKTPAAKTPAADTPKRKKGPKRERP